MSIKEYSRKRTFSQTPEPPPAETPAPAGRSYCIQRHHATRLHYDFRLEIDGALASWAVPQGPSLRPGDKRLAVHVEDHPLEYGGFEGNIPKGNYGAGSVMLWDRGTYEVLGDLPAKAQMERGDFKFRLHGEKLKGEFAIVRMKNRGKGNEWLLLKKKDAFADPDWDIEAHSWSVLSGRTQQQIAAGLPAEEGSTANKPAAQAKGPAVPAGAVAAPMPSAIEPMKAVIASELPKSAGWLYEIKWDGIRAVCFLDHGALRIDSRRGNPCERQYPELSVLPNFFPCQDAILDGEIAVLDDQGRPSFSLIQPRIMASDPNAIANLARSRPAVLFLFDVIYLNGHDLRSVPLAERKAILKKILEPNNAIRVSEDFTDGAALLDAAREQGLEGIVGKRTASFYESRRSADWFKLKIHQQDDFVICGYTIDKREYFGSLVLGKYEEGKLIYVGNVGTGFNEKTVAEIHHRLTALEPAKCPFAEEPSIGRNIVWVRPELVCAVKYHSWTHEDHLRAPVFVGLRLDVTAQDLERDAAAEAGPAVAARPPLLPPDKDQVILPVDGTRVKFTNLTKVLFPRDGYTKRDLIHYYDSVADLILPHLEGRPLSLKRFPNGIDAGHFFQKDTPESFPPWMRFEKIEDTRYVLAEDRASLLYLANLACIDHNPWMSRVGSLDNPDFILIDLDPYQCTYDEIVDAAGLVRQKLDKIGLRGYPKTTGGDGMHVYIPVVPEYTYDQTKTFAEILGSLVVAERPSLFTTPRTVSKREKGKVYFDFLQNGHGKTIAAPYVLRAHDRAPVSTPLDWSEVRRGLRPQQFHIRNAAERFARTGDLFRGVLTDRQRIEPALEKLEELIRGR